MELDILRSFGWAVVELETVLFERYTQLSAKHSVISLDEFRKVLRQMESKGFISSANLHSFRAFKKTVVDNRILDESHPKNPNEEMRLALASLKARRKAGIATPTEAISPRSMESKSKAEEATPSIIDETTIPKKITSSLILLSETTGDEILQKLERALLKREKAGSIKPSVVAAHIKNMKQTLSISEESLLRYIEQELPELLPLIDSLLVSQGSDYLLLSLLMIDSKIRKYI